MIGLDVADLVLIAGRTLELDEDAVLEHFDLAAAKAALAQAALTQPALADAAWVDPAATAATATTAAVAGMALVQALMVHRPFPRDEMRVAAVSGLQFLSVNGWRAELEPPETAAVVIEALASGRLSPQAAADWLAPRLTQLRRPESSYVRLPRRQALRPQSSYAGLLARQRSSSALTARTQTRTRGLSARTRALLAQPRQVWARYATRPGDPLRRPAGPARSGRRLVSALLALGLGSLALLATACAGTQGPAAPAPVHQVQRIGPVATAAGIASPESPKKPESPGTLAASGARGR